MQYQKSSFDSMALGSASARRSIAPEPSPKPMDRRQHERFDLQATAQFSWQDALGVRWRGRGLTRDISETGVFVETRDAPPSGTPVRLEVRAYSVSGSGLLMQTKGNVVRVEVSNQPANGVGFAVVTRSLVLRNCKPSAPAWDRGRETRSRRVPRVLHSLSRKPN